MLKNSYPTNKETRAALRSFIGKNRLYRYVVRDCVSASDDYNGENLFERLSARLGDVSHGCSTGIVGSLIYYSDTNAFYKKYKREIIDLAKETADNVGESLCAFLSSLNEWDSRRLARHTNLHSVSLKNLH